MVHALKELLGRRHRFDPWVKIPWRRNWQSTPVFLPRESHRQRNLSATVYKVTELETTEAHTKICIYVCVCVYIYIYIYNVKE